MEIVTLGEETLWADAPQDERDRRAPVRFYVKPVLNKLKSWGGTKTTKDPVSGQEKVEVIQAAGRPIYDPVEYVTIPSPGDKFNIPDRPATIKDKRKYAAQYAAFKAGEKAASSGTPITALVSQAEAEELKFFNVFTVENMAEMPDGNLPNVGNISHLKQRARDYLAAAAGNAPTFQLRSQLQERDTKIDALERQMAEQSALLSRLIAERSARKQVEALDAPETPATPKRRPGRQRKDEANASDV